MPFTFYDCKTAPSPRRARILLAEKNVPHKAIEIDLASGEQMSAEFRRINPSCTVPALQIDGDTVLTDNAGIAAWIEATYPEPPMFGATALEKAEIASWTARVEMELGMAVANALRNSSPAMANRALPGPHDYAQIPALAERGLEQIEHFFNALEDRLSGCEFIAAERLSWADITAFCFVDFARVVRKQPGSERAGIARWREALRARPAFQL